MTDGKPEIKEEFRVICPRCGREFSTEAKTMDETPIALDGYWEDGEYFVTSVIIKCPHCGFEKKVYM